MEGAEGASGEKVRAGSLSVSMGVCNALQGLLHVSAGATKIRIKDIKNKSRISMLSKYVLKCWASSYWSVGLAT